MGVCTKIWAASAVVVLVVSCVLARPSDPSRNDDQRESRTASGFKYEVSPHQWAYLASTFIPQYTHSDISPLPRHSTTPSSLHLPSNSWFHHSSAGHHRLESNNYITEHRPSSISFGLPLFELSPPTSNLYMMFNRRLSAPNPSGKENKDKNSRFVITPSMYNVVPLMNFLPHERQKQNSAEESNFQNTAVLQSRPTQNYDKFSGEHKGEMIGNSRTESWNTIDQAGTTKLTPHILTEVTFNIAGSTHGTTPKQIMNLQDDEHLSMLQKTTASMPESGTDEVNQSEQVKPTTLVLKPAAKAIAGANGVSIAAPLSRAVVRRGQKVNIHFEPEAVAVVGPGGFADAHSDLLISYYKDIPSQER